MLEKYDRLILLYDFYSPLLTERQRQAHELHYEADCSLSEVAEEMSITRQGVFDLLKRTEKALEGYERRMGLLSKFQEQSNKIHEAYTILEKLDPGSSQELARALAILRQVLDMELSSEGR